MTCSTLLVNVHICWRFTLSIGGAQRRPLHAVVGRRTAIQRPRLSTPHEANARCAHTEDGSRHAVTIL